MAASCLGSTEATGGHSGDVSLSSDRRPTGDRDGVATETECHMTFGGQIKPAPCDA